jgi:hypothetical protein
MPRDLSEPHISLRACRHDPQKQAPRSAKVLLTRSGLARQALCHSVHHRSPIDVPSLTGNVVARVGGE